MREEDNLDRLWEAYRLATPEPEGSVNFMPELWARIEEARPVSWVDPLRRFVTRFLPVAVALTLLMSLYVWNPLSSASGDLLHPGGYVETLANDLLASGQEAI